MVSINPVSGTPSPYTTSTRPAARPTAAPAPVAADRDHDGDTDDAKGVDVNA